MKHSFKITILLLAMFLVTQLIGIWIVQQYAPQIIQVTQTNGTVQNVTVHNLPYGMEPPENVTPASTIFSFFIALVIAVTIMFILMKYNAETFIRIWFFVVVTLAIAVTLNALIKNIVLYAAIISLVIAVPLAFLKVFKRNILIHNITELIIYPGVAAIFVPILTKWSVPVNLVLASILLIGISIYDMYAVWHAQFMQKMAKYQIQKLRLFTGFFVPYLGKKESMQIAQAKAKKIKDKKIKVSVAILGGGDVVFPIVFAGVVLNALGLVPALIISLGATAALAALFAFSEKGKFYPAMPFISAGCFIALGIAFLVA